MAAAAAEQLGLNDIFMVALMFFRSACVRRTYEVKFPLESQLQKPNQNTCRDARKYLPQRGIPLKMYFLHCHSKEIIILKLQAFAVVL